jgi:hypothetical protein
MVKSAALALAFVLSTSTTAAQGFGTWDVAAQLMYSPSTSSPNGFFGALTPGVTQSALAIRATTDLLRIGPLRLRYSAQLLPVITLAGVERYERLTSDDISTVYVLDGTTRAYGVGFVPLGLDLSAAIHPRVRLQVGAGAGITRFNQHIPVAGGRQRNFTAGATRHAVEAHLEWCHGVGESGHRQPPAVRRYELARSRAEVAAPNVTQRIGCGVSEAMPPSSRRPASAMHNQPSDASSEAIMTRERTCSRILSATLLSVTLSGCVIWPVEHQHYPRINGLLLSGSTPMRGVTMSTCTRGQAPRPRFASTVTDSAGRFTLERQRRRAYVTGIFGDPLYQICLQAAPQARELAWTKQTIGIFPDSLTLKCILDDTALQCSEVRSLP